MTRPLPSNLLTPAVVVALFFLLTWPVWQWLWGEWLGNDYYTHGMLIPIVALFLAIQRLRLHTPTVVAVSSQSRLAQPIGVLWLIVSTAVYLIFLRNSAYYLAAFAMIAMIGGLVWAIGSGALLRQWIFPVGYLVLMVPLPFIAHLTYPLAVFAGLCGGGLLHWVGLDLTIVGNAVTLPNAELVIGAQCSGINSLITLIALTVLAAYLLAGPWWGRFAFVLAAIPLAIFGNVLRIASLIVVARYLGADAAFTYYHDYSGIIFFVGILLLLLPLSRLLQINRLRLDVI